MKLLSRSRVRVQLSAWTAQPGALHSPSSVPTVPLRLYSSMSPSQPCCPFSGNGPLAVSLEPLLTLFVSAGHPCPLSGLTAFRGGRKVLLFASPGPKLMLGIDRMLNRCLLNGGTERWSSLTSPVLLTWLSGKSIECLLCTTRLHSRYSGRIETQTSLPLWREMTF